MRIPPLGSCWKNPGSVSDKNHLISLVRMSEMEIEGDHHESSEEENDTLERSKWKNMAKEGGRRDGIAGHKVTYKELVTGMGAESGFEGSGS